MFERFTGGARQVVILAQAQARELGHRHIGTEHLLLGLLRDGAGLAAQVLVGSGLALPELREQVLAVLDRAA